MSFNESIIKDAALSWFGELSYAIGHGPHMVLGELAAERSLFGIVLLPDNLQLLEKRNFGGCS
jgi:hypothetical protein